MEGVHKQWSQKLIRNLITICVIFFYLNTDYQPKAPEVPGAPGLWFCTEPMPDKGVRRVITKIQDTTVKRNNKWLYVGQYEILATTPLTVEEWTTQSTLVSSEF